MGQSSEQFIEIQEQEGGIPMYNEAPKSTGLTITSKSLQDLDKNGIDEIVRAIVNEVAQGNVDAMDNFIYFKKLEYLAKVGVENSKSHAYGKTYATKGNPYLRFGAKVEAAATTSYDYSSCNDPELEVLEINAKVATESLKARQKFLQGITKPFTELNEETGEVNTINPAVKLQSEGYKIML